MTVGKAVGKLEGWWKKFRNPYWRALCRYHEQYRRNCIDEKAILLESQHGKEFAGNVFRIVQYLATSEEYAGYKLFVTCWGGRQAAYRRRLAGCGIASRVRLVVMGTEAYYRVATTAKYLVNDNTFLPFFVKKEGQVYLNTWHGTPLKTLGRSIIGGAHMIGNTQKNFLSADYLLYPNEYTAEHMVDDYCLRNVCRATMLFGGYPRNTAFFDEAERLRLRGAYRLEGRRAYAYMPTFRGVAAKGTTDRNEVYLKYFFLELDRQLGEDEVLFVNLHVVSRSKIDFKEYRRIRPFPAAEETYAFLNACDALVTDYSSTFFDYAVSRRKIVLFTYDREDYLANRGLYFSMDELPFPQVRDVPALLAELRSPKAYDDAPVLAKFSPFEGPEATRRLVDRVVLGRRTGIVERPVPDNGRPNVLVYAGNFSGCGITTALMNLFSVIDLARRNYTVTVEQRLLGPFEARLHALPAEVGLLAVGGDMNLSLRARVRRKLLKWKLYSLGRYVRRMDAELAFDRRRMLGEGRFDVAIHFSGYEDEIIARLGAFPGRRFIMVHSDMLREIATRGNQRRSSLEYAYRSYDKVAAITPAALASAEEIAGKSPRLTLLPNAIDYRRIRELGAQDVDLSLAKRLSMPRAAAAAFLEAPGRKVVAVGRFSPEKGHERLVAAFAEYSASRPDVRLVIVGGTAFKGGYAKLLARLRGLGLADRVLLIENTPNPYAIISRCDGLIMASLYEGFGLVLLEGDILGKPVVSTDIDGPRPFMLEHGGTLVPNTDAGVLQGLGLLFEGKVARMNVDYEAYNADVARRFEALFA
ncbi:MAG: CDP-glycerol glycerophosphotransferase family protein [Kiritimatiellae bacterium]|nr:CDP-glycerol glycerophosphotransferase family protein [Kiritimatiellia bacterium]